MTLEILTRLRKSRTNKRRLLDRGTQNHMGGFGMVSSDCEKTCWPDHMDGCMWCSVVLLEARYRG